MVNISPQRTEILILSLALPVCSLTWTLCCWMSSTIIGHSLLSISIFFLDFNHVSLTDQEFWFLDLCIWRDKRAFSPPRKPTDKNYWLLNSWMDLREECFQQDWFWDTKEWQSMIEPLDEECNRLGSIHSFWILWLVEFFSFAKSWSLLGFSPPESRTAASPALWVLKFCPAKSNA